MDKLDSFFNPAITMEPAGKKNPNEFSPNLKKCPNGRFDAIVRFIPNPADPINKSIIKKQVVWLPNPMSGGKKMVDVPFDRGNIITETFFALKNSGNAQKVEQAKLFSAKRKYVSLVQVLACNSEPEMVGKILVWQYGQKIYEKLDAEMNPGSTLVQPCNPFDIVNGHAFMVTVISNGEFPDYNNSRFIPMMSEAERQSQAVRVIIPDANGQEQTVAVTPALVQNPQYREYVLKYITEQAPDMSAYEAKPWDTETTEFVNKVCMLYTQGQIGGMTPGMNGINAQISNPAGQIPGTMVGSQPMMGGIPSTPGMGGIPGIPPAPAQTQQPIAQPVAQPMTPSMPEPVGMPGIPGGIPGGVQPMAPGVIPAPTLTPSTGAELPGMDMPMGDPYPTASESNVGGVPGGMSLDTLLSGNYQG